MEIPNIHVVQFFWIDSIPNKVGVFEYDFSGCCSFSPNSGLFKCSRSNFHGLELLSHLFVTDILSSRKHFWQKNTAVAVYLFSWGSTALEGAGAFGAQVFARQRDYSNSDGTATFWSPNMHVSCHLWLSANIKRYSIQKGSTMCHKFVRSWMDVLETKWGERAKLDEYVQNPAMDAWRSKWASAETKFITKVWKSRRLTTRL